MKKLLFILITLSLFLISCSDEIVDSEMKQDQVLTEKYSDFLSRNCIPVQDLRIDDAFIYVQGDVVYEREEIDQIIEPSKKDEKALSFGTKPTWNSVENINVFIEPGFNANTVNAINMSLANWENINDSRVDFIIVGNNNNADLTIAPDNWNLGTFPLCLRNLDNNTWGRAFAPLNGNVGRWISINNFVFNENVQALRHTIQHEIGHTLGFWHSNQPNVNINLGCPGGNTGNDSQLPCTLFFEGPGNIMAGGTAGNMDNFSNDELNAIVNRWPTDAWILENLMESHCVNGFVDFDTPENICDFDGGNWVSYGDGCTGISVDFCCMR